MKYKNQINIMKRNKTLWWHCERKEIIDLDRSIIICSAESVVLLKTHIVLCAVLGVVALTPSGTEVTGTSRCSKMMTHSCDCKNVTSALTEQHTPPGCQRTSTVASVRSNVFVCVGWSSARFWFNLLKSSQFFHRLSSWVEQWPWAGY